MRTREQIIAKITFGVALKGKITGIEKRLSRGLKRKATRAAYQRGMELFEKDTSLSRVDFEAEIEETFTNLRILSGSDTNLKRSKKIRIENDKLRRSLGPALGKIYLTSAVANSEFKSEILFAVSNFRKFQDSNDPYGEHDFAFIKINSNIRVFFKIDYYDLSLSHGADPYVQRHIKVLTIGFNDER